MKLAIILVLMGIDMIGIDMAGATHETPARAVTGVVTDRLGNTLPGAVVEIENSKSLAVGSYITKDDGRYYFHQLSPDIDYTLRAKYRNLWSKPKMLDKFNGGAQVTIDLEIPTK